MVKMVAIHVYTSPNSRKSYPVESPLNVLQNTSCAHPMKDRKNVDLLQKMNDHQHKHVSWVVAILLAINTTYLHMEQNFLIQYGLCIQEQYGQVSSYILCTTGLSNPLPHDILYTYLYIHIHTLAQSLKRTAS